MIKNIGIVVPSFYTGNYFEKNSLAKALNATLYPLSVQKIEENNLMLIGYEGLDWYAKTNKKTYKTVAVIFCDTLFCTNYKWCNEYTNENNIFVYLMPDLQNYYYYDYVPVWQTIAIPDQITIEKPNDKILISHSPGHKFGANYKGSKEIGNIIKKLSKNYNIEYMCLTNYTWIDCIKQKSKAHIFIDQIVKNNPNINQKRFGGEIEYHGAIGQSGLEGMLLKCCTITSMNEPKTLPYFPPPPIINADYNTFEKELEKAISDNIYRNIMIEKQYEWVTMYCSPEFVRKNLTRHINGL